MPEAKLVSGRDRTALAAMPMLRAASPGSTLELATPTLMFLVLMGATLWMGDLRWNPARRDSRVTRFHTSTTASFIRPPPYNL
jgi:hypothetical protein